MYSWYIDATADNWHALISNDYQTVFPVTFSNKLKIRQFIQPIFSRQFEVIGDDFALTDAINFIKKNFNLIHFKSSQSLNDIKVTQSIKQHQYIDLTNTVKYSNNAKRLIKKANQIYTFKLISNINDFIDIVKLTLSQKIKEFNPKTIENLKQLMLSAMQHQKGECIGIFENNLIVGGGFFLTDKSTVTYLKGASTDKSKKNGAMYGLINFAINSYQSQYTIFDFGGSNINNVATFYKKFGALNNPYYEYKIGNTPFWFQTLKKLKP